MWPFKSKQAVKSTHRVEVVPVTLLPHNNADSLSIVKVYGYQCVVRTQDWLGVKQAAYIQPDSIVPQTKEYEFLVPAGHQWEKRYQRITARKLRGERSEGLLMPAPPQAKLGDNVAERMGITRYVSPAERRDLDEAAARGGLWSRINRRGRRGLSFAGNERGPSIWIPVYDLENYFRYGDMFFSSSVVSVAATEKPLSDVLSSEPDVVCITEKIHGCNARFVYSSADKRMYAGSRSTWKCPSYAIPSRHWFRSFLEVLRLVRVETTPATDDWNRLLSSPQGGPIKEWCLAHPDHVLFGEIYGDVQDLRYGHSAGERSFVAFDVFYKGDWWPSSRIETSLASKGVPMVPILYKGPFNEATLLKCVNGLTLLGSDKKQIREGCVVRMLDSEPLFERRGYPGRKILKAVSSAYLERSSKDENPQPNVGGL